ncbi:glycosyltransferase [Spiribacter vilamensis]|uniref:Glycosyltransferase involved in cell wall biosynthesis n=1 Tax=Spiribacter vilamensis TaxID=531306 RepID=A0A4Q8CZC8_9GAMM|nr:glycosyltransferase [Spiribacter vilamensis]RZU98363.1 glycosyltransferase involved in cell wall biosynthesis [Spiribacter vilamensis]TVO60754.1 glycosyltransferase family 1 protein [Spiribacter vilamensis]
MDGADNKPYDSVICFGGVDWWYHNRGHYDLQIMREISRTMPVLYVNSIGMKTPQVSEGGMFFRRVLRKLRSLRRGLHCVSNNFFVYSARTPPGPALASPFFARQLARQVNRCARRVGCQRPLLWIACPPAGHVLDYVSHTALVYQRTDRMEAFTGVDHDYIAGLDQDLKAQADVTVFCATSLYESEQADCRRAAFIDHGVDFDRFALAGTTQGDEAEPGDLRDISRPRVGFIGGIDAHTFDPAFFKTVAEQLPDISFVLVGACSLPEDWCALPNVHLLGQRPYASVPSYMAACDALIMPWNRNEWIHACNPVKLKEYLAIGRPVVSTPFPELAHYGDEVIEADTPEAFARAIRKALSHPGDSEARRARVRGHTWAQKAIDTIAALEAAGLSAELRQEPPLS